jgi:hypothetical protein
MGGGGVKNYQKLYDVIYGRPFIKKMNWRDSDVSMCDAKMHKKTCYDLYLNSLRVYSKNIVQSIIYSE